MSKETFKDKLIKGIGDNAVELAFSLGALACGGLMTLHMASEDSHRVHPTLKDVYIIPKGVVDTNKNDSHDDTNIE